MHWNKRDKENFKIGGMVANFQAMAATLGEDIAVNVEKDRFELAFSWIGKQKAVFLLDELNTDNLSEFLWWRIADLIEMKSGFLRVERPGARGGITYVSWQRY